jgi:hypothetical protein
MVCTGGDTNSLFVVPGAVVIKFAIDAFGGTDSESSVAIAVGVFVAGVIVMVSDAVVLNASVAMPSVSKLLAVTVNSTAP